MFIYAVITWYSLYCAFSVPEDGMMLWNRNLAPNFSQMQPRVCPHHTHTPPLKDGFKRRVYSLTSWWRVKNSSHRGSSSKSHLSSPSLPLHYSHIVVTQHSPAQGSHIPLDWGRRRGQSPFLRWSPACPHWGPWQWWQWLPPRTSLSTSGTEEGKVRLTTTLTEINSCVWWELISLIRGLSKMCSD